MGKTVLQHMDSNSSVISYGNEDLAPYRDLPQVSSSNFATLVADVFVISLLAACKPRCL